jgi:hypothetical protein
VSHPLPLWRAAAFRFRDFTVVQVRQRFAGITGAYNHVTQRRILSRRVMRVEVQEFANYVKGNLPDDDMTSYKHPPYRNVRRRTLSNNL